MNVEKAVTKALKEVEKITRFEVYILDDEDSIATTEEKRAMISYNFASKIHSLYTTEQTHKSDILKAVEVIKKGFGKNASPHEELILLEPLHLWKNI